MREYLTQIEALHRDVYSKLLDLERQLPALKMQELANIGFFLRESENLLDSLRKDCKRVSELAQKLAVLQWMKAPVRPAKIQTQYYTATPDIKSSANIPSRSKDPEKYDTFMRWLGVSEHLLEEGLVRVHWPTLKEVITKLVAEGKPLPDGIDPSKTHSHYVLEYRRKGK